MSRKWMCKSCGAVYSDNDAMRIMLSNIFVPVNVEEKQVAKEKPIPKEEIPEGYIKKEVSAPRQFVDEEETEEDDGWKRD